MDNMIANLMCLLDQPGTKFWIDGLELNIEKANGDVIVLKYDGTFMHRIQGASWGNKSTYLKLSDHNFTNVDWKDIQYQIMMKMLS